MQNNISVHLFSIIFIIIIIAVTESEAVAEKQAALKTRLSRFFFSLFPFYFLLTSLASGEF